MMKRVAILLLLPVLFVGAFSFIPITLTDEEVVAGYVSTTQFCSTSVVYSLYLNQYKEVSNVNTAKEYASSVRNGIVDLAVTLAEKFGNGGSVGYTPVEDRKVGQFRYSLTMVSGNRVGYGTYDAMRNQILAMKKDSSAIGYVSCCAFATFCWDTMLQGSPFYITVCELAIHNYFQDIIEGDGSLDYIKVHAQPGDLVFYTNRSSDQGNPPPIASTSAGKIYTHVEVLVGPYSGVNAKGEAYSLEWATVGSNSPSKRRDVCIKNLDQTVGASSTHKAAYMVSLDKWVQKGYEPVDMAGITDSIEFATECPP